MGVWGCGGVGGGGGQTQTPVLKMGTRDLTNSNPSQGVVFFLDLVYKREPIIRLLVSRGRTQLITILGHLRSL